MTSLDPSVVGSASPVGRSEIAALGIEDIEFSMYELGSGTVLLPLKGRMELMPEIADTEDEISEEVEVEVAKVRDA